MTRDNYTNYNTFYAGKEPRQKPERAVLKVGDDLRITIKFGDAEVEVDIRLAKVEAGDWDGTGIRTERQVRRWAANLEYTVHARTEGMRIL